MKAVMAVMLALVLLIPSLAGSAGEPVTFAYSQLGLLAHLPWSVALGQKYFEEQGLEPKGYNFESGAKSIAALIGGSADFAANALEHSIKAKAQGKDLVYVFSSTRLPGFGLAVASAHKGEIKTIADLKGKPVGVSKGTAFSMGNLSSLKETQAILGGEYVFSGAITRPDLIQKRPHLVQKVVTALVKASHFIQTKSPEEIAAAVPADLVGDRAQYIESLRASREIYAPHGLVSQSGVEVLMKSLDSFGVFKLGQKVDVASTYDMTFVRQAMKDLKLQ